MSSFADGDSASSIRTKLNAALGGDFSASGTSTGIPKPGAIGGTTASTGAFTTLSASNTLTLTGTTGNTTADYTAGIAGTTGELILQNNQSGLNVLGVQNNNTGGFSAYICREPGGGERCAFGYGNSTVSYPFQLCTYIESSHYPASGSDPTDRPPYFRIIQTGTLNGQAYGNYRRLEMTDDGWIVFFGQDGSTTALQITNGANVRVNAGLSVGVAADPGSGNIRANGFVRSGSTTVASLPSAATSGAGSRHFVTDATATTFLSTVAGGGANKVPVVSDGTNWLIG